MKLAGRLGNLEFANPVLAASGTFGFGAAFPTVAARLGGVVTKGLTLEQIACIYGEGGACENTWWYSPDRGREWQAFGARPTLGGVPGQAE